MMSTINSAKESTPLTIKDFRPTNRGASLVYPNGPPEKIAPPTWSTDGTDEMSVCQKDFFLKHCNNVPDIPLEDVLDAHDCIGFMVGEEADPWLPVWMCASFYAVDYLDDPSHLVTHWAQFKLERCLEAGISPVSLAAIDYFAEHVCDPPSSESELYAKIADYRKKMESR